MTKLDTPFDQLDWAIIETQLNAEGYAVLAGCIETAQALSLGHELARAGEPVYRRRVALESLDLGRGELRYFGDALPAPLSAWRDALYRRLAPIANRWSAKLGAPHRFAPHWGAFLDANLAAGQTQPQSNVSHLSAEDWQALHQRDDGGEVFPFQAVAVLSEPQRDFTGGEFVMTERRPRMQSRPMVVPLRPGDLAIVATSLRPCEGAQGVYRVGLKHAISRVRGGERIGLELAFHHAPGVDAR
ncbi:Prolyl 4-hydroxylase [Paraburkholderia tropica]|uniref:2OG-Fe(II) oxygenase n=1 Tax=Paraburkholderia tropica TaxID=92647 RepID=UPI001CB45279|nr:2OG-Fe(II) oxygenase [Paraburkholderia tropica]CAG9193508.1 Prolyl 4-hydroxylase [Paraburkholderia tropica]